MMGGASKEITILNLLLTSKELVQQTKKQMKKALEKIILYTDTIQANRALAHMNMVFNFQHGPIPDQLRNTFN